MFLLSIVIYVTVIVCWDTGDKMIIISDEFEKTYQLRIQKDRFTYTWKKRKSWEAIAVRLIFVGIHQVIPLRLFGFKKLL